MKKEKILIMLPLMLLASCDVTSSSGFIDAKIFEEKVEKVAKENVKLDGTLSYKFYDDEGKPTSGDPVVSKFDVEFTDNGYLIDYDGKFDSKISQHLFKSTDNTVELRYINELNEFTTYRPVDKEKKEYDFTPYTNPFSLLTSENLITSSDEKSATFDLDASLPVAIEFVSRLTYHTFDKLEELSFVANDDMVTDIHIATPVLSETLRSGKYTFDLKITATGEDVLGPVEPKPAEPNEKQAVLETALKELQNNDYEAHLSADLGSYTCDLSLFKTNAGTFCRDNINLGFSMGVLKDEEKYFIISYDGTDKTYKKQAIDLTEKDYKDNYKQNWLKFSPVLFQPTENEGEFTLSNVIDSTLLVTFGVLLTGQGCPEILASTSLKINLDENNHIKKLTFGGDFDFVIDITKIGECEMPFNLSELAE